MAGERVQRRLAAILAADVVGYSRLMGADEAGTLARLKTLMDEVVRPAIERHRGRLVETMGDGLLAAFASAVDAADGVGGPSRPSRGSSKCETQVGRPQLPGAAPIC